MILIPYKLNLILNTKEYINDADYNDAICVGLKKKTISDKCKNNINLNKNSTNEINSADNKFKSIILNMTYDKIYWLVSDKKSGLNLKLEITNKDRVNSLNYTKYVLSNGLIGLIELNKNSELKNYIKFDTDYLVLQIIDLPTDSDSNLNSAEDQFINKWKSDKLLYTNIPEIYFYGQITDTYNNFITHYYITKKYNDYSDIIKKNDYYFTFEYFKKLLVLLDKIITHGYIFRNLNMFGLGYEILPNKTDLRIIILNYTQYTLLSLNDNFFKEFEISRCSDIKCVGNLTPYYIIDDYYNLNSNWLNRLNKFYSLALVEIILILFYDSDENMNKLYDFIAGPSVLESQLQYYHFYKRFNSADNINNMQNIITNLNIRFCNINPIFESALSSIIINLLEKDFEKIYYPKDIFLIIENISKSDNEFKINYTSPKNIYDPLNTNIKTNNKIKKKIISDDNLKSNNIYNLQNRIIIPINKVKLEPYTKKNYSNYLNLYKKYKSKYIKLKKSI